MAQEELFCHEFHLVDLRVYENCKNVVKGCEHVFNLAADMGGMGFIQSNHSVIMYNNTMISFHMLEVSRTAGVKRCVLDRLHAASLQGIWQTWAPDLWLLVARFFYASSACIYPEGLQLETQVEGGGLKEEHAWPAQVIAAPSNRLARLGMWLCAQYADCSTVHRCDLSK